MVDGFTNYLRDTKMEDFEVIDRGKLLALAESWVEITRTPVTNAHDDIDYAHAKGYDAALNNCAEQLRELLK